ncbi:restriction endonuclease subunit S [Listeria monocytogenes]|uniref:restriction endonuclease subunit S n=1 Tax=Listeria monocytogenes TaxID=1639 RepID=UPI0010D6B453|nr:restriction endonuclease subunit S [Listeria monocytogenes]EAD4093143.1 restriction endonuclease subunit S [Listeria monocytogenes]EAD8947204.1 restriction endonuclease subunit S [Listeria monocytogenes]EAF0824647.1 restriction endonuclease subunit S [Listeria monocytogenes]EBF5181265.1 restriction endonuclease subunit S [Listeria monocytogenes]ECJ9726310.1 restriction endonuclease subunit S [Listeria monocytogenes]
MSHIKKYAPRRRFEKFSNADDWEQRKLGDHAKYRRGSFPQPYGNKEWYDGEGAMPFVQVVDVTSKLTLVENTKQKISKLAQPKSVFVPKGKVIVTLQGSIGRVAITQYDSFVDRTLLIFDDYEKETDERFWAYTIQKKFEIEKLKAPGGTIKTITKEALSSFDVHLPQFEEQQKIGILFKQLDDTIALHQRKLEKIKALKTAYLSEMFPAEGETKPKRRFAGFTDDWEQRKLEDILDVRSGRDYKHLDSGDIPVYGTGGHMLSVGEALSYEEDAIGIGRKGTIDKPYILKAPFWTVDTLFYTVPKRDSDLNFIHSIFQKINWKSKDESTGVPSLSKTTINAVSVFTPSCSEQKEIGTFFNKLDDTIALHQRKLQKLQNIKKAYLNEMFI